MRNSEPGSRCGFTLIEMLVVVSIIAILAGLTMVGLMRAREHGNADAVQVEVQMLGARLGTFRNAFGDLPPSSLADVKIKGNGINEGNESLFAYLLSKRHGGPFADDLKEDRWRNFDGDDVKGADAKVFAREIDWVRGASTQLTEYTDLWGAPYVYIHNRDYGKKLKYQLEDGTTFEAEARKNPTTGTYYAPTTYQLWSIGPDGINQNGDGDDVVSWQ